MWMGGQGCGTHMDTEAITTFNDTAKCAPWQLFAFSRLCSTGCLTAHAPDSAPGPAPSPAANPEPAPDSSCYL